MSYRMLAWFPAALALLVLLALVAMGSGWMQAAAVHVEVETAKVVWLAGALAAAYEFERGDYLRRGWLLVAGAVFLFLARDVTQLGFVEASIGARALGALRGTLVVAGNAAQVAGVLSLVRVWSATSFDDAVRGQRRALFAGALAAAALLTGPSIVHDASVCLAGDLEGVPHLASDLGDAIGFVLLAALVRTALALRGGVVFWVWSLLAAGQLAYVLFDGARTFASVLGVSNQASPFVECLRVLGACWFGAAGIAQRWIVIARFPVAHETYSAVETP